MVCDHAVGSDRLFASDVTLDYRRPLSSRHADSKGAAAFGCNQPRTSGGRPWVSHVNEAMVLPVNLHSAIYGHWHKKYKEWRPCGVVRSSKRVTAREV